MGIGVSMMCMAGLRRLPVRACWWWRFGWIFLGEIVTGWVWHPPGNSSVLAAFTVATFGSERMIVKYRGDPVARDDGARLGFGRHLPPRRHGATEVSGKTVLWFCGALALVIFTVVRWQSRVRRHVSASRRRLMAALVACQQISAIADLLCAGTRDPLPVPGAAPHHRVADRRARERRRSWSSGRPRCSSISSIGSHSRCPPPISGCAESGTWGPPTSRLPSMLVLLYPLCRWYGGYKAAHRDSFLKYL